MIRLIRNFFTLGITRDGATVSAYRRPLGYQQLSVTASPVVGFTLPTPPSGSQVGYAVVQCEGSAATDYVRWRDDSTDPSASVGMKLFSGQELDYSGDMYKIKFILGTGTCSINISYYS